MKLGEVIALDMPCSCGSTEGIIRRADPPHYAANRCLSCDKFFSWIRKPENIGVNTRKKSNKIAKAQRDYCEVCLFGHEQLFGTNHIEGHHIIPVEYGGPDTPENIQTLCYRCHRMIEERRKTLWDIVEPLILKDAA